MNGKQFSRNSKRRRFTCKLCAVQCDDDLTSLTGRLVCSDLISRGIDISHVSHVVSYDTPVDMRKYVHRVGRTARAGRGGDAWTLVEEQEVGDRRWYLRDHEIELV